MVYFSSKVFSFPMQLMEFVSSQKIFKKMVKKSVFLKSQKNNLKDLKKFKYKKKDWNFNSFFQLRFSSMSYPLKDHKKKQNCIKNCHFEK